MRKTTVILSLLGIVLWGCQPTAEAPEYHLPGRAAFLQQDDSLALRTVAGMGLEEKLQQLLILSISEADAARQPADYAHFGGYELRRMPLAVWRAWQEQAASNSVFPLLKAGAPAVWPANTVSGAVALPDLAGAQSVQEEGLRQRLKTTYAEQQRSLGFRLAYWLNPALCSLKQPLSRNEKTQLARTINHWTEQQFLAVAGPFKAGGLLRVDTTLAYRERLSALEAAVAAGLAGVHLSSDLLSAAANPALIRSFFRQQLQFGGLLLAPVEERSQMDDWLAADADAFVVKPAQVEAMMNFLRAAYRKGDLSKARLNDKVRRLLLARQWSKPLQPPKEKAGTPPLKAALYSTTANGEPPALAPSAYFGTSDWVYWKERLAASSLVLAANPNERIPLASSVPLALYEQPDVPWSTAFRQTLSRYVDVRSIADITGVRASETLVAVLRNTVLDSAFAQRLLHHARLQPVVLVNLGQPGNLALLDTSLAVIQAFGAGDLEQSYAAQLLMGGWGASGRLPATFGPHFKAEQGERTQAVRLGYTSAYQAGIAPQKLVGIDAIVKSAIDGQAFPGAQLLVVKDGKVIYRKAFGHHTYDEQQLVSLHDYYDLASVTKVAATTLAAMQAYEQEDIHLNDRLREHLQLRRSSRLRKLRVEKLLSHRTGLQPHLPVIPYLLERGSDNANCEGYFCASASADFPIPVSDRFYFSRKHYDRIWNDMQGLRSRYTRYRYSDVNFVLLQRLLEAKAGMRLDSLVDQSFYQPLGLQRLTFLPLRSVPPQQIVPTENDHRWRHQLVHGYVHDETAALLGGVAGHAGLFGNADDLAVVFQMLLNGGVYGQQRFFEPETIERFTTASYGNHRGLGFDKPKRGEIGEGVFPEALSSATFGHTGFTGTCVWSDPEQQLTYIFLSNRIHPDRNNSKLFTMRVRERVHEVIYDALGSYEVGWPRLVAAQDEK